jgi:uncharacterized membrane protein YkgB
MAQILSNSFQLILAFVLLNVWLVRFNKQTPYRGGQSTSLKEEFLTYGLPSWFSYIIGTIKVCSAILLIVGIWIPQVVLPVSFLVAFLMLGAITMHVKIRDPLIKSLPALILLLLSGSIIYIHTFQIS